MKTLKHKRILLFLILFPLLFSGFPQSPITGFSAPANTVVISEIAWMGTYTSSQDEWIELYNNTSLPISLDGWVLQSNDGDPLIPLMGIIPAKGYFLLERTDDNTVPNVVADQIYSGILIENLLNDSGEVLSLTDNLGNKVDFVNKWYAGESVSMRTMERNDSSVDGTKSTNWSNSTMPYEGGFGTPKKQNSNKISLLTALSNQLSENTLQNNVIALNVSNATFSPSISQYITLNNAPPGTTIRNVFLFDERTAFLALQYDGTNFDNDIPNFSVTVSSGGLNSSGDLTSNNILVKAISNQTIEGSQEYTSTGTSYPTDIEMAGYNTRDKLLFLNSRLITNKNTTGKTPTFYYFISIFDQNSNVIGTLGDYDNPMSIVGTLNEPSVELTNEIITLNTDLTKAYRILIVIKSVQMN
jgi:hypothetical protein